MSANTPEQTPVATAPDAALAQATPKPADPPAKTDPAKEAVAPDIKAEQLWDGRKIVPFKRMDYPKMVKASEADFLDDDEYILGVTVNGESRAYPTRFVWFHHVVNDKIGKAGEESFFAVTYCSVCNTGVRYDTVLNGKPILLDFYGLYNGVATLCDHDSESVFLLAEGRFVKGSLLGKRLKVEPLLDTTWGQWKQLHPDTFVMSPEGPFSGMYRPKGKAEPRGYDHFPAPFFKSTLTRGDLRLPPFDKVLGVTLTVPGAGAADSETMLHRAYPIKALQEAGDVLNDIFDQTPVGVFLEPETITASAFSRKLEGKLLTFEARKQGEKGVAFYDKETGTRWNIEGKGEEGPLAGKELTRLENHLSQWYGWSAYFPDTSIVGRTDPPQPGDPFAKKDEKKDTGEKPPASSDPKPGEKGSK